MSLINVWVKTFGQSHVMSRNGITKKLQKLVDSYWNDVYSKAHRKKGKGKTKDVSTFMSIRHFNKNWRTKALNKTELSNGSLLDIGSKMESLTGAENIFYEDQKSEKECQISEEIDCEYEREQENVCREKNRKEQENEEKAFIEQDIDFSDTKSNMGEDITINQSLNCSGLT